MSRIVPLSILLSFLTMATLATAAPSLRPAARGELARIEKVSGVAPQVISVRMNGAPSLVIGKLSPHSSAKASDVALAFVAKHPALFDGDLSRLEVARVQPHAMGRTVRLQQLHKGVPVLGAHAVVITDLDGVVRAVSNGLVELGDLDVTAKIGDIDAAQTSIEAATWFVPRNLDGFYSRLVVLPVHSSFGVLAWELHFGRVPGLLSNLWFYVDAKTGELLMQHNRIQHVARQGLAFETNPGAPDNRQTPVHVPLMIPEGGVDYTQGDYDEEIVSLLKTACDYPDHPLAKPDCPEGDAIWLRHPLHATRNCVDYNELFPLDLSMMGIPGEIQAHLCSEVQTASADENGDFLYSDWRDDQGHFDDLNPNDKFAEVQMFYHVQTIYNYFLDLMNDYNGSSDVEDWEGHAIQPLMATVNFKLPINMNDPGSFSDIMGLLASLSNPNSELHPFDNAMFMPGGPGMPGLSRPHDSIVFGQGTRVDYSWDGDVVYHEFTHSVDNSVTGGGTVQFTEFADRWGINTEPGGMSEGFADTFPAFVTNEPTMGEYSLGIQARDLTGHQTCPENLTGQVHADSPMWSQSNYQGREAAVAAVSGSLSTENARRLYEQATFIGLSSVVADQGFGATAAVILLAVEELMGATAKAAAAEVYAAHKTDDCPRVYSDNGTGEIDHTTNAYTGLLIPAAIRQTFTPTPFTPGILQWELTVPEATKALNLSLMVTGDAMGGMFGSADEPDMRIIVRHGSAIQFTYQGSTVNYDSDVMGPYPLDKNDKFSLVGEDSADLPAGKYYLMAVNQGKGRGAMYSPYLSAASKATADEAGTHVYGSEPPMPDTDDDPSDTDQGTDQISDTDEDDQTTGENETDEENIDEEEIENSKTSDDSGCGCLTTGTQTRYTPLVLLLRALGH